MVDDHALIRAGLRMVLEAQPDFTIVGECATGADAIRRAQELQPDVVLMDISLPDMLGFEATRAIRKLAPGAAILALTMHESEHYFFEMVNAGASGYVPKRAAPDELLAAIRAVAQGGVYLTPSLARTLVKDYLKQSEGANGKPPAGELTEREHEVLRLIADGLSNAEVAARLSISAKTVERHRANIFAKLNLRSRAELVKYAIRKGLIDIAGPGD
jgi:two-component system response regulator NreC